MPAIRKANDEAIRRSASFRVVRALLLSAAFAFPFVLMTGKSITGDEVAHIPAGYSYLVTREVVLNPMHPPLVKELCALPLLFLGLESPVDAATIRNVGRDFTYQWEYGQQFFLQQSMQRVLFWSRIPAVLLSVGLAWLVLRWATDLWGALGGLLALSLYVFDPNVTAHAELVTTDVGCALSRHSSATYSVALRWLRVGHGCSPRGPLWGRRSGRSSPAWCWYRSPRFCWGRSHSPRKDRSRV